jgi:replicative DNA helicase
MSDDRTLPHDIEAEQCALGGMLLSAAAVDDVAAILASRDYYRPAHAIIHGVITDMHERGEPADAVTVAAELTRRGEIGRVQGAPYLHTLIASVPTAANAAWYARIVRERAILRRLIETGTRIVQLGYSGDGDGADLAAQAEAWLASVTPVCAGNGPATSGDVYMSALRRLEAPEDQRGMIAPPWDDLRDLVPVFRPGQLITIGARPGAGKSVIASDVLRYVGLKLRLPSVLFSLEMAEAEVTDRMLAAEAAVSLSRIQACELDDLDWARIARLGDRFTEGAFVLDDTPGITLAHIRSRLRAMARTAPARIAIVDYLQLMKSAGPAESREREVAAMAAGLKQIAREFAIPVLLLAQLNRGPEHRTDKKPTKADLRESGAIENDSDVVILIHRPDMSDPEFKRAGEADLIVDKNRAGPTGTRTVLFQGHYGRFVSQAWSPSAAIDGERRPA